MGARTGGGGGKSRRSPLPSWKKNFTLLFGGLFAAFFTMCGDLFVTFSPCGWPFLSGEPFLGLPPPLQKFIWAPMNIDMVLLRTS